MRITKLAVCLSFLLALPILAQHDPRSSISIANQYPVASGGTTVGKLVVLDSTGLAIQTAATSSLSTLGIAQGTSSSGAYIYVTQSGPSSCVMDGTSVVNDFITISTSVAGDCHDTGVASSAGSGAVGAGIPVIGVVQQVVTVGNPALIQLSASAVFASGFNLPAALAASPYSITTANCAHKLLTGSASTNGVFGSGCPSGEQLLGVNNAVAQGDNENVSIGANAFPATATGGFDTAVGASCLQSATTGSRDTCVGFSGLSGVTTGSDNTAIGYGSLGSGTNFSNNTAIGSNAASSVLSSGNHSVFVGDNTAPSGAADTNEIVVGSGATGNGSNTATVGNSSVTAGYIGSHRMCLADGTGGGDCNSAAPIAIQTNTTPNASQSLINFTTSTANAVGLTITPINTSGGIEKFEVTGSSYTGNAATATTATNLAGGALGSIPYQSAANTTTFVASPTTTGHTFAMGWQPSGSAIAPVAIDFGTGTPFGNPMTTLGDTIYGGASGVPTRLAGVTTTSVAGSVLVSNGVSSAATAPQWISYQGELDASNLTVGTVNIASGTTQFLLYNNGGKLGNTNALPNGTTATTQSAFDTSTKVATTAYADLAVSANATYAFGGLSTNVIAKGYSAPGAVTNSSITDNGTTVTTTEVFKAASSPVNNNNTTVPTTADVTTALAGYAASNAWVTWTPTDVSGGNLTLTSALTCETIAHAEFCHGFVTYPATIDTNNAKIGGLPVTSSSSNNGIVPAVSSISTLICGQVNGSSSNINFYTLTGIGFVTNAQLSGATVYLSFFYQIP